MIEWNQIDLRLAEIGKDRAWLAEQTNYSAGTIRTVLAPNSDKRSDRSLSILSRAIEDEEARQAVPASREIRPGVFEIFQTEEQLHTADLASRIVGAPSLSAYCRDVILAESDRLLDEARRARSAYPTETTPNLKVAGSTGSDDAPNPVE
jgi:hypothetical protein